MSQHLVASTIAMELCKERGFRARYLVAALKKLVGTRSGYHR
jgi:hypothetical protein